MKRKYYEAYEDRYKVIHEKGHSWSSNKPTPMVLETIKKLGLKKSDLILEIGCGEGRDSKAVLDNGYSLLATDISIEAINYCKQIMSSYSDSFMKLDCLNDIHTTKYTFIYAVAILHMLVLDEDRKSFYQFIYSHLKDNGTALIFTMGDGKIERSSNINEAFDLQNRNHESGEVRVAATSCRMVSFETFEKEIKDSGLEIINQGITSSLPDFNMLMYAHVRKNKQEF